MESLAIFLNSLGAVQQLLILAVFLAIVGFALRFCPKLRPYTGQVLVLAAVFWIGLIFAIITYSFPKPKGMMASATDAGSIPILWFVAFIPFAVLTLLPMLSGIEKKDKPWGNVPRVGIVVAIIAASLFLFEWIGYYLSSALFIVSLMWLLKSRDKVQLIAVPAGWVVFTYLLFARLLYVPLPVGKLFSGILG